MMHHGGRINDALQWLAEGFETTLRPLLGKFLLVAVFLGLLWPYLLSVVTTLKAALGNDGAEEERARALRALQAR